MVRDLSLPALQFQSICLGPMCHLIPAQDLQFCTLCSSLLDLHALLALVYLKKSVRYLLL